MSYTALLRRAARQLTVRRLFPVALLLVLVDLFWTVTFHPWLPEQNPLAAALQAQIGWTGVGIVAVAVMLGIFEFYKRLDDPFGRIGAVSVTTVLAGPAVWNTSLFVRLDGWSTLWGPTFETTAAVAIVAAVAWVVFERATVPKLVPSADLLRPIALVALLVVSVPAMSFGMGGIQQQQQMDQTLHSTTTLAQTTETPDKLWEHQLHSSGSEVMDVVAGDDKVISTERFGNEGRMIAADPSNGDELWRYVHSNTDLREVAYDNGTVWMADQSQNLVGVDSGTGDSTFTTTSDLAETANGMVAANGIAYAASTINPDNSVSIMAVDSSGTTQWTTTTSTSQGSVAIAPGTGKGYTGDYGSGDIRQFDLDTGTVDYTDTIGSYSGLRAAASDGEFVYFGSEGGDVIKYDPDAQSVEWTHQLHSGGNVRSLEVSDGIVYSGDLGGNVTAADASSGDAVWQHTYHDSGTAVNGLTERNGYIYSAGGDGTVIAVDGTNYVGPTVSGTVTDLNGDPADNVTIELGNSGKTTTTDANGQYEIAPDSTGQNTITADSGLDSEADLINVTSNGLTGVDFQLIAGDVGGQVVACDATDPMCDDPTPVENATVEVVTLNHTSIENQFSDVNSAEEAIQKAEEIEEELDVDPEKLVPDEYTNEWQGLDPEAVEDKLEEQSGETVVAAHDTNAWGGYEGTYLNSKVFQGTPKPPQVQFDANEQILLSVWDPSEDAQTTPDEQLGPGNLQTGDIKIEIEKLGPTADDGTSRVNTPDFLTVTEGVLNNNQKTHEVAQWRADPGIYALSPENSDARTIIKVGDQDASDLYQGYMPPNENELRDRIQHFKEISNKFENYSQDDIVGTERVPTGPGGQWSIYLDDPIQTVGITAYKGDGAQINASDLSTGLASQLIQAEQLDYDGKVFAPREPQRVEVPVNEPVRVRTTKLSSAPLSGEEGLFNDILDGQFEDWLNESAPGIFEEFGLDPENASFDDLTSQYEDLRDLANQAPEEQLNNAVDELSDDQIQSIVGGELDAPDSDQFSDTPADREALTQRLNEMEAIVDTMRAGQAQTDPVEVDIGFTDSPDSSDLQEAAVLSGQFPFPGEIDEDSVNARVEYADGTTEPIPEDQYTIGSAGGAFFGTFNNAEQVTISGYEVSADKPSPALRVDAVVDNQQVMTSRGETENPQYEGEIPRFDAVDVSSLTPDPGETVEVTPRVSDDVAQPTLLGATVIKPDGSTSEATIEDGSAVFSPQSAGSHTVEFEYQNAAGDVFIERASINAQQTLAGTPPTVRVRDGGPPIAGNGIDSATVDVDENTVDLLAQANTNRDINELHIREADALSGEQFNLEVVEGNQEERIDSFVSVTVYDDVPEDALLWRGDAGLFGDGQPITHDGNQFGELRNGERIRTYTEDDGTLTVTVQRAPGPIAQANHRVARLTAGLPVVGTLLLGDLLVGLLAALLSLGGYRYRRVLRGVLP